MASARAALSAARLSVLGLAAGLTLAACGAGPADAAHQVQTWATSTGFNASLRQLRGDLARLPGLTSAAPGTRRTVCDVLVTDALTDNQQLPTPDGALTSLLSHAYGRAANAGRSCFDSAVALGSAQAQGMEAERQLTQAEARYDQVTSSLQVSG